MDCSTVNDVVEEQKVFSVLSSDIYGITIYGITNNIFVHILKF